MQKTDSRTRSLPIKIRPTSDNKKRLATRECARVRDNLVQISATKISAGVSTGIGSHVDDIEDKGDDQFEISDGRSVDEVYQALLSNNMQPVMSDYIYV